LEEMHQHEDLGQFYRRRFVDDHHFVLERYDSELMSLRSSSSDRCVRPPLSLANRLYPPQFPDGLLILTI
jgi:hypothetical protein